MALRTLRLLASAACALILTMGGCYEIPPVIHRGYVGGPTAQGWPPLAAYHAEPFHPRNRWFQREFGGRSPQGDLLPAHADEPLGAAEKYSPVDRAELCALLEAILLSENDRAKLSGAPVADLRQAVTEAIFRSDALAEASRVQSRAGNAAAEKDLVATLLRAARRTGDEVKRLENVLPPEAEPPPLREGEWLEAEPAATDGDSAPPSLFSSAGDLRWTRVLREKDALSTPRWVLLRLRVALDERGEPLLLSIANECWELEGGGTTGIRSWRFDRAEWLSGREPWHEVPGVTMSTLPVVPASTKAPSQAYTRVLDFERKAAQLGRVKEALRRLLDSSSG